MVLLALLSAMAYGTGDFIAGVASRRISAGVVAGGSQFIGLLIALFAALAFARSTPTAQTLEWGALSGVGSGLGALSLYRGLAVAQMSTVATVSAVLAAVVPVIVGVSLGEDLSVGAWTGIALAVPAILLVSAHGHEHPGDSRRGLLYGSIAGLGFALMFIALDRAGNRAGAWPVVPSQLVCVTVIAPFLVRGLNSLSRPARNSAVLVIGAGVLSGSANLLFLAATGRGPLAVVAVLTALYPAVTVLLARLLLSERWSRTQVAGLIAAAIAITLVTIG